MKKKVFFMFIQLQLISSLIFSDDNDIFYEKLIQQIPNVIGLKEFPSINNHKYNGDCSGFVAFLFHLAGLNIRTLYGIANNGTKAIWDGMVQRSYVLNHDALQPGDMIFFDNTYDMNKDGKWNDELSHIGVVESIDEFGTIIYVHHASRGVARGHMNLIHPTVYSTNINGKTYRFNDLLRNASTRGVNADYLSGNLYRGAARIFVEKKQ